jgi:SAM-dependent methyltransferase
LTHAIDLTTLAFDQYQRNATVAVVADLARAYLERSHLRVLDVGGLIRIRPDQSILPLSHFLPEDHVVAVDLEAEPVPNYALANGLALPFATETFDLVASCDTLEHVPPDSRFDFVDELLRAACQYVVLIAPVESESSRRAEHMLHNYVTGQGLHLEPLREHLDYGLPSADALLAWLAGRGLATIDFPDGYLPHWLAMMLVKCTSGLPQEFQRALDRCYNRHFSAHDRLQPAYRRAFVIAKSGYESLLPIIADTVKPSESFTFPDPSFATDFGHLLQHGQSAILSTAQRQFEEQLAAVHSERNALLAENAELRQTVTGYEQGRFIRLMRWLRTRRNCRQR